jgi:hypothetical protein
MAQEGTMIQFTYTLKLNEGVESPETFFSAAR